MKSKTLIKLAAPVIALSLVSACGTMNKNRPVNEAPVNEAPVERVPANETPANEVPPNNQVPADERAPVNDNNVDNNDLNNDMNRR